MTADIPPTELTVFSLEALANDALDGSGPIKLNAALTPDELAGSLVATRGLEMLEYARDHDGIGLTKGGALNRKFLAWAVEAFHWPDYEADLLRSVCRVIDESDFVPGQYLHEVMKRARLMRRHRGKLVLSPRGRDVLASPGSIQAALFPPTFKERYLASLDTGIFGDFDMYFGLMLWQVRQVTGDRTTARDIFESAVAANDSIHWGWDDPGVPALGFYMRVLRVLEWFGLLVCHRGGADHFDPERYTFQATPLFDRFVTFDFD